MPEQSKFENVELFASLEAVMKQNTGFYCKSLLHFCYCRS